MRISGTEPSSVILSQTKSFKKLKSDAQKVPKQAKAKGDGVITHKITIWINFNTEILYQYTNTTTVYWYTPSTIFLKTDKPVVAAHH